MGIAKEPPAVKLIAGFIFKDESVYAKALSELIKLFGVCDFESRIIDFDYTDYYQEEMGSSLKRRFVSFKKLIPPQKLPQIKIITNKIEQKLSLKNKRNINIDPGYVDLAKLVLATTKDFKHRIYLDKGIFAEITLFYQNKTFCSWELTYPDYRTKEYILAFNKIRDIYNQQIK